MPYAMISPVLPKENMGAYMGIFNLFIVVPQVVATLALGPAMKHLLNDDPMKAVVAGGGCFVIAAVLTLFVRATTPKGSFAGGGGGH
jgi:maltose/moltooligosaccharide transporter